MSTQVSRPRCPRCGLPLLPTPLGLHCAPCLFEGAIDAQATRIGDYELFEQIGEGATGVVYLARHVDDERAIAIKLARTEGLESGEALAIFRQDAASAGLRHSNIARVQRIEIHEGRPLLVMELYSGGTLANPENARSRRDPASALDTMLKIVRAVQYAHQHGVLHCDLKPDNILLDEQGEPHVSDFGLARSLRRPGPAGAFEGGTWGWMSPEQVRREPLSTASDRFSLGLLLHWLLTGQLLFGADSDFAERVVTDPRRPPGPWQPTLDWALRAIVYRATQLDADQRYASTAALAEDLERARDDRPIEAVPVPGRARLRLYGRRHPLVAAGVVTLLFLCLVGVATAVYAARKQTRELRALLLDMNAYAARGQAASVLYALRDYGEVLERAAGDPSIREIAKSGASLHAQASPVCGATNIRDAAPLLPYAGGFDSLIVVDTNGCPRARTPLPRVPEADYASLNFAKRDYFLGAKRAASRGEAYTYVARAFHSMISGDMRFAVSRPIYENGDWVGVVVATISARSTLDTSRAGLREPGEQVTALLGGFEAAASGAGSPDFAMLVHPNLPRGERRMLDPKRAATFHGVLVPRTAERDQFELGDREALRFDDYVDPLLGGRWLAAVAPVGGTGYVVLVQTRDTVALRPSDIFTRRLATGLAAALFAALLLFGAFAWAARRASLQLPSSSRRGSTSSRSQPP